jgi:hypothetical protein
VAGTDVDTRVETDTHVDFEAGQAALKSIAQTLALGSDEREEALPFSTLLSLLQADDARQGGSRDASADRARIDGLLACLVLSPHSPVLPEDGDPDRAELGRRLFDLRRRYLDPKLVGAELASPKRSASGPAGTYRSERGLMRIEWLLADETPWHMVANLGTARAVTGDVPAGQIVYREGVRDKAGGSIELDAGGVKVVSVAAYGALDARQRRA